MIDYKSIGDSKVTKRQKRRGRKPRLADRAAWGLIYISVTYIVAHLIHWGIK